MSFDYKLSQCIDCRPFQMLKEYFFFYLCFVYKCQTIKIKQLQALQYSYFIISLQTDINLERSFVAHKFERKKCHAGP